MQVFEVHELASADLRGHRTTSGPAGERFELLPAGVVLTLGDNTSSGSCGSLGSPILPRDIPLA